ncbi:hypothetical protein A7J50_3207 [Pseudomonas antarctica]|uniref:Uncharacterized protein n=1 Tax=Pseudomonas antarctica TaxID=219572 RepID=A0A172Z2C0_9PSED|nr:MULTISPECIES: hypothetical protein [Pseudomonas]ANF86590.1 hypothetical protein A7J50_3207 [Pseudomonas antarctica]UXV17367.1 hypothetical protein N4P55_15840 [Pseudomonas fluorescens]
MRAFTFTLFAAIFALPLIAQAQAGDESGIGTAIITPAHPVWLLEQPYADSPMLTARTFGVSAYGGFHVKASLEISCHPQNPTASLALQITPQSLGFDSDPFEGKDASANGPLRITTGTRASIERPVNGVWTYAGAFQIGTVFALSTSVAPDELAYWISDASRGQTLKLSLAPATEGAERLTATFALPENNNGLKKIIQSCQGIASATPR